MADTAMESTSQVAPSMDELLLHANTSLHEREPKCCCGRPQCAILAHNSAALEGLEKDLVSAAQIGQALLARHETHMAEAEAERNRMTSNVEQLEADKIDLEAANAKTIDENRRLLDQLEELNSLVSSSDTQIQLLTATLQSTSHELDRLAILSQRTMMLEDQLSALEAEQSALQSELVTTEEGKRSAMQRWKRAESTISELQEQVDRIEKEAREERERHVEVLSRMEKRRSVERELENAAGRLKGAAVLTSLGRHESAGNVVSHFVKDILQDNSNLQTGVLELRELLMGSNAEVETLREQLRLHRPLDEEDSQRALSNELRAVDPEYERSQAGEPGSSLHVHHHYHAANVTVRKSKKKKPTINTNRYASSSGASTPVSGRPRDWRAAAPASISTILAQTSVSVPPIGHQHQLSAQSTHTLSSFAPSSVPSSPRRASSVFDNIDGAFEMSRPTTPESSVCNSPLVLPTDALLKGGPRSVSGPVLSDTAPRAIMPAQASKEISVYSPYPLNSPDLSLSPFGGETIVEETEHAGASESADVQANNEGPARDEYDDEVYPPLHFTEELARPVLRRAASHESLISVSGMDIHTLRSRPSQLLIRSSLSPYAQSFASPMSPQAVTSHEVATVRPVYRRSGMSGGDRARELLAQARYSRGDRAPSLTRKVGGWVWSRWGMAPVPGGEQGPAGAGGLERRPMLRPPGVNQSGPIMGFVPKRTPVQVEVEGVDQGLLQEALADGKVVGE